MARRAKASDAEAVLALMAGLGRPDVASDPREQADVFVLASGHQRAEAHQLYENYGFTHSGRVYGLMLT